MRLLGSPCASITVLLALALAGPSLAQDQTAAEEEGDSQSTSVPVAYLETKVQLVKLQSRYQAHCKRQRGRVCLGQACGDGAPQEAPALTRLTCAELADLLQVDTASTCQQDGWNSPLRTYLIQWPDQFEVLLLWSAGEDRLFSLAAAVSAAPDTTDYGADRVIRVGCQLP